MRIINYVTGIEGVSAGGISTVNLPVNRRYHGLKLLVTDGVETDPTAIVEYVRLIVNGVVMRDLTPAQIIAIAEMNGQTVDDNIIPIYFSEPWRASVIGEESTSWDLFGQVKATLEVKFLAAASAPAMKVQASFDYGRNVSDGQPFLAIVKQLRFGYNAPSGNYDVNNLPVRFPIQRILLTASTGTIDSVEVYRDSQKVFEAEDSENNALLDDYGLDASKFTFPIVFDHEQQISSPLRVDRELNLRVNSSAANSLTAILEHRANGYV